MTKVTLGVPFRCEHTTKPDCPLAFGASHRNPLQRVLRSRISRGAGGAPDFGDLWHHPPGQELSLVPRLLGLCGLKLFMVVVGKHFTLLLIVVWWEITT